MHDLKPLTPLGSTTAQIDRFAGLTISECPDWALASLAARRGREQDTATAAQNLLGTALPDVAATATSGDFTAFWTGPQQWMIEAPHDSHEELATEVKSAVGDAASVTEQTDGWCRFDLEGTRCHDVLERLCNADTRAMTQGQVTRTRLEHLGCFLICRTKDAHFSVIGPRSSAGSIHHALTVAAASAI
ncbi:sarcosine oxidase subunit gamma [Primorskyibacter marinus]|uniref:sarcosine oxidase subunit gamma n=1 Tax=Primorskyibacter marinus TaxID=1977320 RepID=UPI000E30522A|nr:sarcosine oxidase, gamma subunit [Primorskyibacter marinus]